MGELNGHDFFFFVGQRCVNSFHELVVNFLQFGFGIFFVVFAETFFDGFLEFVNAIAAHVANTDACCFT